MCEIYWLILSISFHESGIEAEWFLKKRPTDSYYILIFKQVLQFSTPNPWPFHLPARLRLFSTVSSNQWSEDGHGEGQWTHLKETKKPQKTYFTVSSSCCPPQHHQVSSSFVFYSEYLIPWFLNFSHFLMLQLWIRFYIGY